MRFDLPEDRRLVFEMIIPIRWGDMDAYGHVNNAVYFRYLETVRVEWLRSLTLMPDPGSQGQGPVIVNAFCSFHRQLAHPGDVLARQYVGQVGRSSVQTYTTLSRHDAPDEVCASGGAKVVWVDLREQVSRPLPESLRQAIGA